MLTLPAAAALLGAADSLDSLAPLAAAAGFTAPSLPLDARTRRGLGLDGLAAEARIIEGAGTLRALLIVTRRTAHRCASAWPPAAQRLSRRAPHLLWLLFAAAPGEASVAIAAWSPAAARSAARRGAGRRPAPGAAERCRDAARADRGERGGGRAHARLLAGRARARGADAALLSGARGRRVHARRGRARAGERGGAARTRAAAALAAALPRLPRGEGLARRRPALPRAPVHALHGARRATSTGGCWRRSSSGRSTRARRDRAPAARAFGQDPLPERRTLRADAARAPRAARLLRRVARRRVRRAAHALPVHGARGFVELERGRDRSGDARQGARVADERANAARQRELLHAAEDRGGGDDLGAARGAHRTGHRRRAGGPAAERGSGCRAARRRRCSSGFARLRLLDPACGSGRVPRPRARDDGRARGAPRGRAIDRRAAARVPDARDPRGGCEPDRRVALRAASLALGGDRERGGDPLAVPPLPNLDRNIRVGDALAGRAFGDDGRR